MNKYRLNMKRIITNICIVFLFIIIMNIITNFTFGNKHTETRAIIVNSNDTLWGFASDICEKA